MRYVKAALTGLFLGILVTFLFSCAGGRLIPRYDGVDPQLELYVQEYKALAKYHGITFNNEVSIGFANIDRGNIIGETYYGLYFREIDIDRAFWFNATPISRTTLMMHELDHAYCLRGHDYGEGKQYDKENLSMTEGRFKDFCPLSIMYPYDIDDNCAMIHYQEYIDEMFERCIPF